MKVVMNEQDFCNFLQRQYPSAHFSLGHSVIVINVVHLNPVMSCAYFSDEFIAVAKYNRQLGVFSDNLLITQDEIAALEFQKGPTSIKIDIFLKEQSPAGQPIKLTLNVSLMTAVKWHKENLKRLLAKEELAKRN